jgi:translation initiation factor IF-2
VVAGEAGGITQHIGAYSVKIGDGRKITFLDTPGHEAFTAMRARGAQVTDIVILIVAADDSVMPQTVEAISHAQAANVPMIIAINKVDKPDANPERIRQQLADRGVLVEEWGGRYQSVEISAKKGLGIDKLLEKILLEAEILDLKANPDRNARGVVIESELDKGKGVVATVLVQKGTLKVGDNFVAGSHYGRVRAMMDERGNRLTQVGPSEPAQILGFSGAPTAGDGMVVLDSERDVREIAVRRQQLRREQDFKQQRHITLDDISEQIARGGVQNLPLIIKGDVDGSVEALADSLLRLSTPEVQVSVIMKSVGEISESDVLLATASDAIIIGFHVRPNLKARKLAEREGVDIRLYQIIYDAVNEIRAALEGMLRPEQKEVITGTVEIRDLFKVSRVGTIAGCYVQDGKITRNDKVRLLRDGLEIYSGGISSLRRIKDDVREVEQGYECGVTLDSMNDIKVGDIIEAYKMVEVKRKLEAAAGSH